MSSHVFVVFAVFRGNQRANRRKTHNKACNWSIKDSNKFIISVEANDLYYHCGYSISQQIEGSWRDCIIRWPIIARYKLGKGEQLWWSMRICHSGWECGKEYGFCRKSMKAGTIYSKFSVACVHSFEVLNGVYCLQFWIR